MPFDVVTFFRTEARSNRGISVCAFMSNGELAQADITPASTACFTTGGFV